MASTGEVVAIIPARGASKGIPGKNIRILAGQPLIAHTIRHARESSLVDRVYVSTDDPEIAAVARSCGAEVIDRPEDLSTDTASSESALTHALEFLGANDIEPELVVFLQATSPIRRPDEIDRAIRALRDQDGDSLFSACRLEGFLWRNDSAGLRSFSYDHTARPRRQDAPEDLVENGSIYVFKPWVMLEHGNRLGGKIIAHRMSVSDSFQIDEPEDLALAESLLRSTPRKPAPSFENVRLLVLDFDGVMTDNRVLVDQEGREGVYCSRGDGFGIALLRETSVEVFVLSAEENPVVSARCKKLGIEVVQGCKRKLDKLKALLEDRGLSSSQVAYVGNDLNDLECMEWVGVPIAVANAEPALHEKGFWITTRVGGDGAVREVCDLIAASNREGRGR